MEIADAVTKDEYVKKIWERRWERREIKRRDDERKLSRTNGGLCDYRALSCVYIYIYYAVSWIRGINFRRKPYRNENFFIFFFSSRGRCGLKQQCNEVLAVFFFDLLWTLVYNIYRCCTWYSCTYIWVCLLFSREKKKLDTIDVLSNQTFLWIAV